MTLTDAAWLYLFTAVLWLLSKVADEDQRLEPAVPARVLPPLPPPLVPGPLALRAYAQLEHQARTEPLRAVAAQGGLFLARMNQGRA